MWKAKQHKCGGVKVDVHSADERSRELLLQLRSSSRFHREAVQPQWRHNMGARGQKVRQQTIVGRWKSVVLKALLQVTFSADEQQPSAHV